MRIFVISRGYPSAKSPQWGCFEKDQAEALARLGHEVVMLSVDTRFRLFWRTMGVSMFEAGGVAVLNAFYLPSRVVGLLGGRVRKKFEQWQLEKVYRLAVQKYGKPDLLYSHYLFITNIALSLKQKYHVPLVGIEHWSEINKPELSPNVRRLGEATYPHLDGLIAVADSLRQSLRRHFAQNAAVVHNMAGREFTYRPGTQADGRLHYIATGSLIHRKGFDLLVKAFAQAGLDKARWQLDIVGGGPEREKLQAMIDAAGLSANITLVGQRTKTEIATMLQQSNVFVLPSRNENFSVAVLEALACGLPVIASVCGGIRECIDEQNGLLFPVDDVDALTKALQQMQQNYSQYDRQQIAADCQARFSPEVIAQQLTDVFESVLTKKEGRK